MNQSLNNIIYGTQTSVCKHLQIREVDPKAQKQRTEMEVSQILMGEFFQEESADVKDNLLDLREQFNKHDVKKEDLLFGTPRGPGSKRGASAMSI